jgi:hypothetical protein
MAQPLQHPDAEFPPQPRPLTHPTLSARDLGWRTRDELILDLRAQVERLRQAHAEDQAVIAELRARLASEQVSRKFPRRRKSGLARRSDQRRAGEPSD